MKLTMPTVGARVAANATEAFPKATTGMSTSERISSKPVSGMVAMKNAS